MSKKNDAAIDVSLYENAPSLYPSPSTGEGGVGVIFILRCAQLGAWGLFERRGIHEAAVFPKGIQTAFQLQRGVFPDTSLKNFPIVADLLDDIVCPFFVKSQRLSIAGSNAQKTLNDWVGAFQL